MKKYGLDFSPASIEMDSRKIIPGSVFVAVKGRFYDGHDYISQAISNGAKAVAGEMVYPGKRKGVIFVKTPKISEYMNSLAYDLYRANLEKMDLFGVTGTNGKTSTVYFLHSIFNHAAQKCSLTGTVENLIGKERIPSVNTTPFAPELFKILSRSFDLGFHTCAMEISSHSLKEDRIHGLEFSGGIFTNITVDHMDYHGSMDDYINSKMLILSKMRNSAPMIINIDDPLLSKNEMIKKYANTVTFGQKGDFTIKETSLSSSNASYTFIYQTKPYDVELKLSGSFAVYNSLGAIALAVAKGMSVKTAVEGAQKLKMVPGRFQAIRMGNITVIVDYAHTPDALEKLLASVKQLQHESIITVFGAGGDRDNSKRPLMGKAVEKFSDLLIVTSDNPRTEDPEHIIDDILKGISDTAACKRITDRREAIRYAVRSAKEGDIIIIAGKGHEDYQILGNNKVHFSDLEEVKRIFNENK